MSLGADLENTSLSWLDRVTETSNGTVERNNRVLASSAERLAQELAGVYDKIQTRDRGKAEAQQLNARLNNLGDLLDPTARKVLQDRMATDLATAQKMGGQSATDLAKLLGSTSDTLNRNAKPNTAAIDNAGKRLGDFWAKENTLFRDRVTALTQVAAAEGKSWRQLSNQVRELLILERKAGTESARSRAVNAKLGITGRAELIARTEMQTAYIQGQLAKFRQMGFDWARWSATAERSCPYCIARDGLVYQLQEVESSIPAHPRCRCSLIPVDPPANWGKGGGDGIEAAESLDDAYWARSRSQKIADFRKANPRFNDKELIRYVNTPTNAQAYLRPGQPAPQPVWSPSGSLIPNLEQVVLNAAAAARNMQAREQQAEAAEAERLEQERERLEAEATEAERLAAEQQRLQQEADNSTRLLRQEQADLERQLIEARQKGTAEQESIAEQIAKLREQISRNEMDARVAGEAIDALNKRQVELAGELERITVDRNLQRDLQRELDSAQQDANALNDRRGKAYLEKFQAEQRLKIAREKLADLEASATGKGGEFDVEAYDRTIAQQNHDVETLQRIGEDVLKRAGVTLTEVQQPAAGGSAAEADQLKADRSRTILRIDQYKKDIAKAKKNIKINLENQDYAIERVTRRHDRGEIDDATLRARIEEIKANTAKTAKQYEDFLVTGAEALSRLENQLASLRAREAELQKATSRSAAQAVIDELYRTSPITKAQAAAEVELAANAVRKAAAKRTSADKVSLRPVPKDMGLEHMIDAVHLYGTRSSMDAYGLSSARAHANNRRTNTQTGDELRFSNGDRAIGYVNSGDLTGDYRGTQFHELGHHLEFQNSDFYRAARKFIEARKVTPDERPTWLGDGYARDEVSYKGKAYTPYVLKEYDLRRVADAERYVPSIAKAEMTAAKREWLEGRNYTELHRRLQLATEVVSMGVEKLSSSTNLQRLAEMDPEHMLLTLGIVKVQQARARAGKDVFGRADAAGPVATVKDLPDGSGGTAAVDKAALKRLKQEAADLDKAVKRVEAELETIARDSDRATDKARALFDELAKMPSADELKAQSLRVAELTDTVRNDKLAQTTRKRDLESQIEADSARLAKLEQQAAETLKQAEAQVQDLEGRLAQVKARAQEQQTTQQQTGPPDLPPQDRVGRMAAADIEADPSRFQYKLNANKDTGEVGSLRGVETWNEDLAGVLSVWKDPANGQTYVINGHNRLALAKRLGVSDMPVIYVQAKTAAEARAIGAKQNIANGDGTAIDAAKFMRDTGQRAQDMLAQGLNLKGKVARDGAALAELPDFMFNAVAEGRLSVEHGSAIGRSGLTQGQMADAYKVLQSRPSMSPATLDEVLLAARASRARVREETTLFGTDKVETSTMIERAELAAKVRADQSREVRTLDKAAGKADVLATRGNRIDVQQAQVRAAEAQARADVFDLLKNRPTSKVAKALNDAAVKIQDATNRAAKGKATAEGRALVDAAIDAEVARMTSSNKGLLRSIADLQAKRRGEFADPPELALAVAPADLTLARVPTRLINPDTAKAGTIGSVRPDQISADAKRFQYKAATDAQTGEVGSLEGVRRFDPALAGVISVWKDPADGVTYVINGHNRLAAARRLGADAVSVRYIAASNPAEARAIGALANIAEGQGTAIDAAKFMREMGYSADDMKGMGVPLKKSVARDGANLASLPDALWDLVVQERLSVDKASEIGGSGLDAEGMAKVADTLSKRPNASLGAVRELVAAEKASMEQGATLSLFNDPTDATYQLDRAQLTRGVRDELLGDKRLFGTLATSRAAETLKDAGSTLDTDANRQASAEADRVLAVFDQLKNVSGPVSDALNRGARELANAKSASDRLKIQRQIRLEVVEAVAQEMKGVPSDAPEPPPEAPGQVGLFG